MAEAQEGGADVEDPTVLTEELLETLKLLDYERGFLSKGFKPATRGQFAMQLQSQSEQFVYYTAYTVDRLAAWLLQENGSQAAFNKYDDPSTIAGHILGEVQRLGLQLSLPSTRTLGQGAVPCLILTALAKNALKVKQFAFRRPEFESGGEVEAESEEGEDESEVLMCNSPDSDPDTPVPEAPSVLQGPKAPAETESTPTNSIIWPSIPPNEWQLECQRVASRLQLPEDSLYSDTREWRTHLQQANTHRRAMQRGMAESERRLSDLAEEVAGIVGKVAGQERRLNEALGDLATDYRTQADALQSATSRYKQLRERTSDQQSQFSRLEAQLQSLSVHLDRQGQSITDNSPLLQLKEGLKGLQRQGKELELTTAVLAHSLFQAESRGKS